jgi:hypothetical protein
VDAILIVSNALPKQNTGRTKKRKVKMKPAIKIYGLRKPEAELLAENNLTTEWLKDDIGMVYSKKLTSSFKLPAGMAFKKMQPNIRCEEISDYPGFTTIVCGLSGKPLFPYKITRNRLPGTSAYFAAPITVVVIDANASNWVIVTQYEVKMKNGEVSLKRETIENNSLASIEIRYPQFANAAAAAVNRAKQIQKWGAQSPYPAWAAIR